jgi:hypothetical protein
MLLDELRLNKNRIEALARQYGARHIRVFGSVARCEERPDSDVDFLVDLPRGYDMISQRLPLDWKTCCAARWNWYRSMSSTGISASA